MRAGVTWNAKAAKTAKTKPIFAFFARFAFDVVVIISVSPEKPSRCECPSRNRCAADLCAAAADREPRPRRIAPRLERSARAVRHRQRDHEIVDAIERAV